MWMLRSTLQMESTHSKRTTLRILNVPSQRTQLMWILRSTLQMESTHSKRTTSPKPPDVAHGEQRYKPTPP